jgi:hypothetical protein
MIDIYLTMVLQNMLFLLIFKVVFKRQSSIDKANNKFGHLLQISPDKDDAHGDADVSQSIKQADRKRNSSSMQTTVSGLGKRQSYLYYKVHYYLNSTIRTVSLIWSGKIVQLLCKTNLYSLHEQRHPYTRIPARSSRI